MSEYEVEMSPDVIGQISMVAANEAARVFNALVEDHNKSEQKRQHKKTQKILEAYRRAKRVVGESENFTDAEKVEIRMEFLQDLMGDSIRCSMPDRVIKKESDRRETNKYLIYNIDRALRHYKEELDGIDPLDERARAYRVLRMKYVDDDERTIEEIMAIENISRATVFRDINAGVDVMTFYMDVK